MWFKGEFWLAEAGQAPEITNAKEVNLTKKAVLRQQRLDKCL